MSTHDDFWLARYAHNTLMPVLRELEGAEAYLAINISIDNKFPGLSIYVHQYAYMGAGIIDSATTYRDHSVEKGKQAIDSLARRLPNSWAQMVASRKPVNA